MIGLYPGFMYARQHNVTSKFREFTCGLFYVQGARSHRFDGTERSRDLTRDTIATSRFLLNDMSNAIPLVQAELWSIIVQRGIVPE
jgi:hypothetical protein